MTLFDLISKPEIFLDDPGLSNELGMLYTRKITEIEKNDENLLDIVSYYNKIKKKENDDDMEGRLVKLLDNDMKQYFQFKKRLFK